MQKSEARDFADNVTPIGGRFGGKDPPGPPLPPGDGFDGMSFRVARLEDQMKEVLSDLKVATRDLQYIRGRIDAMPTTLQLLGFVVAIFAATGLIAWLKN